MELLLYRLITISTYLTLFTGFLCIGQAMHKATSFVQHVTISKQEQIKQELEAEVLSYSELLQKAKDQSRFVKKLFYKIQRDRLTNYANNARLDDLFIGQKNYDCVTGTAVYALVLDELGIDYSIKETDFHVYLLVHLPGKDILLEPTDPINGFIDNPIVIGDRIRAYRNGDAFGSSNNDVLSTSSKVDSYSTSFFRDRIISLAELAGLQYYNLATDAFNNGKYTEANSLIEIALTLYPNDRFYGFRDILLIDMSQSMSTNFSPRQE